RPLRRELGEAAAAQRQRRHGLARLVGAPAGQVGHANGTQAQAGAGCRLLLLAAAGQQKDRRDGRQGRSGEGRHQPWLRVATRGHLGSRARTLREKVQMSVTWVTAAASPSTTLPSAARVTLICSETKRTVTSALRLSSSASVIAASVRPTRVVLWVSPAAA